MVIAVGEITIIDLNDVNISTTPPLNPVLDQLWLDTSTAPNVLKRWDGTTWIKATPTEAAEVGAETPEGAQDKADEAADAAKQAAKDYASTLLQSMADGTFSGTFIDGKSLISPTVVGLQGTFAELMAGNPFGARLELGEAAGEPFLEAYDGADDLRVKLLQDRLQFYTQGVCGGEMRAITLLKESGNYHYLSISADGDLAMISNGDLDIVSGHAVDIMAHDEDMHAWIKIEALYPIASLISLNADSIFLRADAVWIDEGDLRLRDPAGSARNKQIDFTGGYSLWRDDAGAGGNKTRLWLDTPHAGEVVVGPRASADYLGQIRIRTLGVRVETGSGSRWLEIWGPTEPRIEPNANNTGYVGGPGAAFKNMYAYNYNQASARDVKANLELADGASCYDQLREMNFWKYNLKDDVDGEGGQKEGGEAVYLGVIAEESPDIICDAEKKNINLYPFISLIGAAVQEIQGRLEAIEKQLAIGK